MKKNNSTFLLNYQKKRKQSDQLRKRKNKQKNKLKKKKKKKKEKIEKDLKALVNKKKKGGNKNEKKESSDEESDDQIKENKKGVSKKEKSTKKDKNSSAYKDAKKTKDMSPLKKEKKEAKPMSEEDQNEYLKAFEKHKEKKPFDVPVKMTKHDQAKPSSTTINKELKNCKCILIVNVASQCGHTSKHYQQLTELYNKYKDRGFSVFAFPCDQYGG